MGVAKVAIATFVQGEASCRYRSARALVMAGDFVRRPAALRPALLVTGHGPPLGGERLADALEGLGRNVEAVAPPEPRSFA